YIVPGGVRIDTGILVDSVRSIQTQIIADYLIECVSLANSCHSLSENPRNLRLVLAAGGSRLRSTHSTKLVDSEDGSHSIGFTWMSPRSLLSPALIVRPANTRPADLPFFTASMVYAAPGARPSIRNRPSLSVWHSLFGSTRSVT